MTKSVVAKRCLVVALACVTGGAARAGTAPQGMTLQGRILNSSGQPLEAANVTFTIMIRSPGAEDCLLFEEVHTLNMSDSGGVFSLGIGSGARPGAGFKATSTLKQVFANSGAAITGLACGTGSAYTPSAGHKRRIRLSFDAGSGAQLVDKALDVQAVPYALQADSLQGKGASDFVQVNNATAALTQFNLESVFANAASVTELQSLIAGTSSSFVQAGGGGFAPTSSVNFNGQDIANATGIRLNGAAGRELQVDRSTAADTAGNQLVMGAGGASSGAQDKGGGKLVLAGGASTGTGTSSIEFQTASAGASGTADNAPSTKMTVLGNGNVGIGTTSPSSALDVDGALSLRGMAAPAVSPVGQGRIYFDSVANKFKVSEDNGAYADLVGGGGGGGSKWTAAGSDIYYSSGKVGIGTASPQRAFHVVANDAGTPSAIAFDNVNTTNGNGINLSFRGTSTGVGGAAFKEFGAIQVGYATHDDATLASTMKFYTRVGGATVMPLLINSTGDIGANSITATRAGDVGIGTANPSRRLHVSGAMTVGDHETGVGRLFVRTSGTTNNDGFVLGNAGFSASARWWIDASGAQRIDNGALADKPISINGAGTGNVGIGTATPGMKLDVNGDIRVANASKLYVGAIAVCDNTGCLSPSDARYKENIAPLENSLENILKIQGVGYDWGDKRAFNDKRQIGFIAQDLEKVYPEVVKTDEKTGMKSVMYDKLVAPLVEALKTLHDRVLGIERRIAGDKAAVDAKVRRIESENDDLKSENKALKRRLDDQQKELEAIKRKLGL